MISYDLEACTAGVGLQVGLMCSLAGDPLSSQVTIKLWVFESVGSWSVTRVSGVAERVRVGDGMV